MGKVNDLTGKRYGKLLVLRRGEDRYTKSGRRLITWICLCDCGNETIVMGRSLRNGSTKSCGCGVIKGLQKGWEAKTHGMSKTRLYRIWCGMKKRTSSTADKKHKKDYYDRGIRTCKEWKDSFETFYEWAINNGYRDDLSIDRIDNDGNYCPEN